MMMNLNAKEADYARLDKEFTMLTIDLEKTTVKLITRSLKQVQKN